MIPKFSIITVAYNEEKTIDKTIESVYLQDCTEYEYILIDGKSRDQTLNIIIKSKSAFEKKGIKYTYISEKDGGIYDAMNKAIDYSSGEWLIFMNAGDCFAKSNVLSKTVYELDRKVDILYGSFIDEAFGLYKHIKPKNLEEITRGMIFSHQSAFIKREILEECNYNLKYRISADYNFFLKMYVENKVFKRVDYPIAIFARGGASASGNKEVYREMLAIENDFNVITKEYSDQVNRWICKKEKIAKIKKRIPVTIYRMMSKIMYRRRGYIADLQKAMNC